jgi:hypothetical protein
VGVVDHPHDADFLLDLCGRVLLLDLVLVQDLDRHGFVRLNVDGTFDFPKRTFPQRLMEHVLADRLAVVGRHGVPPSPNLAGSLDGSEK